MEEFCKYCGICCFLYKGKWRSSDSYKEAIHEGLFEGDLNQYGVKPLESINGSCEFLGENGCIIERSKRPKGCLDFECKMLKEYKYGNKEEAKKQLPEFIKANNKKIYK